MPKYSDFEGFIFDVDDTLLTNYPGGRKFSLHEESRLEAIHAVGKRHRIPALQAFTDEQNDAAFRDAPVHSLEGAVWNMLLMTGQVHGDVIDMQHPLLQEVCQLKDALHEDVLRTYGEEVPGAPHFVHSLATHGFADRLALASTAIRRDIMIALEVIGLAKVFPDKRIISKDMVRHTKPHPEAFELAFQSLELPSDTPRRAVMAFEDDPRGVMSAKAAGLYVGAITTRFTREQLAGQPVAPDLIADSYHEFAQLLSLPLNY